MATTPFTVKPTLRGRLATLRPIELQDVEKLSQILNTDPEVAQLTGSVHASGELAVLPLDVLRKTYAAWTEADDRLVLGVVDNSTGHLVGEVVLNAWDPGNNSCGYRTWIGRDGRGRGLGTEATRLIINHGLTTLGLHRISLEVYAFNPRARHVYEKVGFVHEGTGRQALRFDDGWVDVDYMAILATDSRS